jgi:hypothetical protein
MHHLQERISKADGYSIASIGPDRSTTVQQSAFLHPEMLCRASKRVEVKMASHRWFSMYV